MRPDGRQGMQLSCNSKNYTIRFKIIKTLLLQIPCYCIVKDIFSYFMRKCSPKSKWEDAENAKLNRSVRNSNNASFPGKKGCSTPSPTTHLSYGDPYKVLFCFVSPSGATFDNGLPTFELMRSPSLTPVPRPPPFLYSSLFTV